MSSSSNACPICDLSFPGNLPQLQRHVNEHLDVEEHKASVSAAEQLALAEGTARLARQRAVSSRAAADPLLSQHALDDSDEIQKGEDPARALLRQLELSDPSAPYHHPNHAAQPSAPHPHGDNHDEIQKGEDPARLILQQLEQSDAELARAITAADAAPHPSSKLPLTHSSFADSIEHCYLNVIRKIMPNIDMFDQSRKAIHLSSRLDLYSSNLAGLGWDCGYRNIQIIFSALLYEPASAAILAEAHFKEVPSIPEIAASIESAWSKGYDPEGAAHFEHTLTDKEAWIGATEAFVLFRALNFNVFITNFETPTDSERKLMFQWIFKHFDKCCSGRNCSLHLPRKALATSKPLVCPIFCQWQGHSLTIVGAEKTRNGDFFLVVLDPSRGFYASVTDPRHTDTSIFLRDVKHPQFSHPRFQLVSIMRGKAGEPSSRYGTRKKLLRRLRFGGPS
ncbi:unnamed protein product [Agarophyton chilense]|eukprot:gb/GEZJ01000966.1/.p1 GENE.gb/GEZJ01000966.1/~~gb/GEZJ01000966.1/.p1  ORF type:complete len:451 (+),score=72.57 gb/GEZJ01000966.1/:179-1531(+)